MEDKKTKADPTQSQLRKIARAFNHRGAGDLPALAESLRGVGAFDTRQVRLLVDAAKADVLQDLETPPAPALRGLVRERLASRILCESDATHEEAVWAVETWAGALGAACPKPESTSAKPALSWNDEPAQGPDKLHDRAAPESPGGAPQANPAADSAPPRYVPQPIPLRSGETHAIAQAPAPVSNSWGRWAVIAAIAFVLILTFLMTIALPNFSGHAKGAAPAHAGAR